VSELAQAAAVCKTSFAEYYPDGGALPTRRRRRLQLAGHQELEGAPDLSRRPSFKVEATARLATQLGTGATRVSH
jgi:hypothetical protein